MLRILFAVLAAIHGLIHLMGFVKEFKIAKISELSGKTIIPLSARLLKVAGILWLSACLLFIVTALAYLKGYSGWWMPASAALIISQLLIIVYWHDAKFGTLANIIILLVTMVTLGTWSFNRMVNAELSSFQPDASQEKKIVTAEMIAPLPVVVQKWLQRCNMVGQEMIHTAHLHQFGEMRTKPEGAWMPVHAEQYFTIDNPAFLWKANVRIAPLLFFSARDKYIDGQGHMLGKLLSLVSVSDATGKEINQGALLRYLAEISWFPSAALCPYITWEQIDSTSARATITGGGISADGVFTFTEEGDVKNFQTQRYFYRKEGSTLETWLINTEETGYKEFQGIRVPAKSTVTWKLKTGDFNWYKVEIVELEYNK